MVSRPTFTLSFRLNNGLILVFIKITSTWSERIIYGKKCNNNLLKKKEIVIKIPVLSKMKAPQNISFLMINWYTIFTTIWELMLHFPVLVLTSYDDFGTQYPAAIIVCRHWACAPFPLFSPTDFPLPKKMQTVVTRKIVPLQILTHTHTHSRLWPNPPRTSFVLSFVPVLNTSHRLCTRMTSEDRWEQRTDSRGPIVPIEKCPQRVWSYKLTRTHWKEMLAFILVLGTSNQIWKLKISHIFLFHLKE